jgi:hypothetical protein
VGYHCYQRNTKLYPISFSQGIDEVILVISVGFVVTDRLLIKFLHLSDTGEKWEYSETVHQLFVDFNKKAYYSVKREVLYNILIEIGVHMKKLG